MKFKYLTAFMLLVMSLSGWAQNNRLPIQVTRGFLHKTYLLGNTQVNRKQIAEVIKNCPEAVELMERSMKWADRGAFLLFLAAGSFVYPQVIVSGASLSPVFASISLGALFAAGWSGLCSGKYLYLAVRAYNAWILEEPSVKVE